MSGRSAAVAAAAALAAAAAVLVAIRLASCGAGGADRGAGTATISAPPAATVAADAPDAGGAGGMNVVGGDDGPAVVEIELDDGADAGFTDGGATVEAMVEAFGGRDGTVFKRGEYLQAEADIVADVASLIEESLAEIGSLPETGEFDADVRGVIGRYYVTYTGSWGFAYQVTHGGYSCTLEPGSLLVLYRQGDDAGVYRIGFRVSDGSHSAVADGYYDSGRGLIKVSDVVYG